MWPLRDARARVAVAMAFILVSAMARAQDVVALPDVDIVGTAPLLGSGIDRSKVPTNTQVLRREDLERTGPASALRALDERIGGVSLNQAQGNPFQPNLNYRGFEASPLAGNPQGLAVYLNGSRFNQPFGDTTNFDLIPDIAVERIELVASNPAFGLNALGGALSIKLRDGFTYNGAMLELSGGSFGRVQASGQYGARSGNTAAYMAATGLDEAGWRDNSPSQLRQFYGDIGWRGDNAELHLNILGANNNLTGNGSTPVDLLSAQRNAVFTTPDETRNKYVRIAMQSTYDISDTLSLQATAYYSNLSQRTRNGDAANAGPCDDNLAFLCVNEGGALTTRGGAGIANFLTPGQFPEVARFQTGGPYAVQNETATDTNGYGTSLQATRADELFGHSNRLIGGVSYDGGVTGFTARSLLGELSRARGFVGPGIIIDQADGSIAPASVSAANNYYGLYGSDTFDITSRLSLSVSGRLNVAQIALQDRIGTALSGDHIYARFNPAAGLTYQITPGVSVYGGYSESNRAPTPAELSCASAASPCTLTNFFVADPSLKQVVARTYEAGLRGKFKRDAAQVTWNAGLFRTNSSDDILFTSSDVTGRGFFQNVGSTRRQGVEAGVSLKDGGLTAFVDYAYVDATFQSSFSETSENNPLANANGQIQVRAGDRIPGIPAHLLKFGVQYDVTPAWSLGGTGVASSGRFLQGDEANLTPTTGAYAVLNLNTSYRVTDHIELFGLVQNLLNAKYATFGGFSPVSLVPITQAPNTTNTRSLAAGPPLAGYGGVRVTF